MRIVLDRDWLISSSKIKAIKAHLPCTVLSSLIENKVCDNPYFRDNEEQVRKYLFDDYTFSSTFSLTDEQLRNTNYLFLDGIMTIAEVFLNNVKICELKDQHLAKTIKLDNSILKNKNEIKFLFKSPYNYIKDYPNPGNLFETYAVTDKDSPKIRQANYMFGWDWAPSLADMGITKQIAIISTKIGYFESFRHYYHFEKNKVDVEIIPSFNLIGKANIQITLSGYGFKETKQCENNKSVVFTINNPKLWYPTGYGEQPLYDLKIEAIDDETIEENFRLGIRDIKIDDSYDDIGRNFALYVNGKKIFVKGSNYVPEDNILPFTNKERTERLLKLAKDFNHNTIRVWGGSYYPEDYFFDLCDELGLLVFEDLMFACASYNFDDKEFRQLVIDETVCNLRRIRHHASLYLISGNNEIEDGVRGHGLVQAKQYLEMFHGVFKDIVSKETDLYYLTSSPTSGEPYFSMPNDTAYLDTHYWWVWCQDYPLEAYTTIQPRLLSEFGLQSLSTYDTTCAFTNKEDRTINSPIMCFHQKDPSHNNNKIINYTKSLFKTNDDLKKMSYLSMLTQAEGIKMCVENLRQHKERCNGALYWQLNDSWPTQSCSSIDYYFGLKALHYYSKKFYSKHLVSININKQTINISNDSDEDTKYTLVYSYFDINGKQYNKVETEITVNKYSSLDFEPFEKNNEYLGVYVVLKIKDEVVSDNYYLFNKDKDIDYPKAELSVKQINDNEIEITANTFVRGLNLNAKDNNIVFSDNYFNLLSGETKIIKANTKVDCKNIEILCVNNI